MSKSLTTSNRDVAAPGAPGAKVTPRNAHLVLADISSSMDLRTSFGMSRIDCLRKALTPYKGRVHVVAFNNSVMECDPDMLPAAYGGTSMHKALDRAAELLPRKVLLMSDGEPDLKTATIEAAKVLAKDCNIDTLFIGDPNDEGAKDLMRQIAEIGGGSYSEFDLGHAQDAKQLGSEIDKILALPAPSTIVVS